MPQLTPFAEALDAADKLSADEKVELIAILHRRMAEEGRRRLIAEVQEAKKEYEAGQYRAVTVEELMRDRIVKRQLVRLPTFVRKTKKLLKKQPQLKDSIVSALELLERDAFHPSLRTHKLKGELAGSWSCSVGYDLRIVFTLVEHEGHEAILLQSLGTHDEAY